MSEIYSSLNLSISVILGSDHKVSTRGGGGNFGGYENKYMFFEGYIANI